MIDLKTRVEELIKRHEFDQLRNEKWHEWQLADLADFLLSLNKTDQAVYLGFFPEMYQLMYLLIWIKNTKILCLKI